MFTSINDSEMFDIKYLKISFNTFELIEDNKNVLK